MVRVIAWPPVGVTAHEWTQEAPVVQSRSLLTGQAYQAAWARTRRVARLEVSSLAAGRMGAGYMEMLRQLLEGGIHRVRLTSWPVNWHVDVAGDQSHRQAVPLDWTAGEAPLDWTSAGTSLHWYSGTVLTGEATTEGGWPALRVTGLPPGILVARPAEFVALEADTTGETTRTQAIRPAYSDAEGVAVVRLMVPLEGTGRVDLGVTESRIFEATSIPRAVQPVAGDWRWSWAFRECFADELDEIEEVDPW